MGNHTAVADPPVPPELLDPWARHAHENPLIVEYLRTSVTEWPTALARAFVVSLSLLGGGLSVESRVRISVARTGLAR